MNMHAVVAGTIAAVNPLQPITVQLATGGYAINPDGTRVPVYQQPIMTAAQVQQLTTRDLRQLAELNIQGSQKKIYVSGNINGVVRFSQLGGDLVTLEDGTVWLTTLVLESWPDWCAVSVTLQIDSAI